MFWKYLRYVLKHKWYVYQAGRRLGLGRWQLLTHDWSKFLPDEWRPYNAFFNGPDGPSTTDIAIKRQFNEAWLRHLHRQPHHWQHWILVLDSGSTKLLDMPERYIREMVADWRGAGMAQGKAHPGECATWYLGRRETIQLSRYTRARVETMICQLSAEDARLIAEAHRVVV